MTTTDTSTRFEVVSPSDPRVQSVLEDLVREYDTRYGNIDGHNARAEVYRELEAYERERRGVFLVLFDGDAPIASGAARSLTEDTVEFKKIWTHPERRGEGLASRLLVELEDVARGVGYEKVFLTTGPRQPEADRLYERSGYTAHYEPGAPTVHPYTKALVAGIDGTELPEGQERLGIDFAELVAQAGDAQTAAAQISAARTDAAQTGTAQIGAAQTGTAQTGTAPTGTAQTGTAPTNSTTRRILPRRHWGRWAVALIVLFLVSQFAVSLVKNPNWRWDVFAEYFLSQAIVEGLILTLLLTAIAAVIGFLLGAILAVMRMSESPILKSIASGYIWFFRAVPLVVQLVVWYNLGYLWPTLGFGTPFTTDFWLFEFNTVTLISAFTAAILGLSLHEAAYSAEIIRGGLLSVDQGQVEAARALGLPRRTRFFRIVLPQALRSIVPNAFNSVIGLVKGTSVVFIVALPELFYTAQVIYNRNQLVIPLLLVTVVWYAVITTLLNVIQHYIERHYAKGHER
ncbi:MAG: ABC transporter permease subunit [Gulosibacter sp.]|uniref:ABC transporter permease subunit n=1 Tax=Gulosibacter sp. TaxID=2817531 RepID=UPI003F90E43C